jgi:hypothetical protein
MADQLSDEMLTEHRAYECDDRIGNRWFQGRYRPGIREWGYPIRLPAEEWGPIAKIRGGFDERSSIKPTQRSSRED